MLNYKDPVECYQFGKLIYKVFTSKIPSQKLVGLCELLAKIPIHIRHLIFNMRRAHVPKFNCFAAFMEKWIDGSTKLTKAFEMIALGQIPKARLL